MRVVYGVIVDPRVDAGDAIGLAEAELGVAGRREQVDQQGTELARGPGAVGVLKAIARLVIHLDVAVVFFPVLIDHRGRNQVDRLPLCRSNVADVTGDLLLAHVIGQALGEIERRPGGPADQVVAALGPRLRNGRLVGIPINRGGRHSRSLGCLGPRGYNRRRVAGRSRLRRRLRWRLGGMLARHVGRPATVQNGRAGIVGILLGRRSHVGDGRGRLRAGWSGFLRIVFPRVDRARVFVLRGRSLGARGFLPIHIDGDQVALLILRTLHRQLVADSELRVLDFFPVLEELGLVVALEVHLAVVVERDGNGLTVHLLQLAAEAGHGLALGGGFGIRLVAPERNAGAAWVVSRISIWVAARRVTAARVASGWVDLRARGAGREQPNGEPAGSAQDSAAGVRHTSGRLELFHHHMRCGADSPGYRTFPPIKCR